MSTFQLFLTILASICVGHILEPFFSVVGELLFQLLLGKESK